MVPAELTEKPRQVCKAIEGSEHKAGFHIPSKDYEELCDAQSPVTEPLVFSCCLLIDRSSVLVREMIALLD